MSAPDPLDRLLQPSPTGTAPGATGMPALLALAASEAPSVRAVAREFEALLVGELTRGISKPLPGTKPLVGGSAERMYREQFFEQVARLVAERGGLGIAEQIERQLGAAGGRDEGGSS